MMLLRAFARGTGTIGLGVLIATGWAVAMAPAAAAAGDSAVTRLEMSLRQPEVAKVGRNRFKVVVEDASGQPLQDAEVWLTLYRRGVPGSKGYIEHPVQTKVELAPGEEAGVYEAVGPIVAAGLWDVKMQVKPRGARGKKISATTKIWADH
jgi:YtkA-like protein